MAVTEGWLRCLLITQLKGRRTDSRTEATSCPICMPEMDLIGELRTPGLTEIHEDPEKGLES